MPKLANTSLLFTLYRNRKLCANGNSSFLSLSETFRSMFFSYFCLSAPRLSTKILFFVFPRRALTPKISFLPFRAALKYLKSLFRLSAPRLSTKNLFFVFPRHALTPKFSFLSFCAALKHLKNSIPCLCRCQKHQFSFFHAYVVDRSDYFLHFAFMSLTEAIIFFILRLCR